MLISLAEYAKKHGKEISTVRQLCLRGNLPTAQKIGHYWVVEEDTPYPDHRIKSGKYRKKAGD